MALEPEPALTTPRQSTPLRIAHRGGNTRLALRRALAACVDWIETDVWLRRDRLIARHDRTLWRLPVAYSRRSVSLVLWPALRLERLLQATEETGTRVLIDLKGAEVGLPAAIVERIRTAAAYGRTALCGQEWEPLDEARRIDPAVEVIFSLGTPLHLEAYLRRRADGSAPLWTSCNHRLLDLSTIERLKAAESRIIAWTVDSETRAQQLVDWGVDGITSNRYAMLNRLSPPNASAAAS